MLATPETLDALHDALALRSVLAAAGLSRVRYATVAGPADVRAALAGIGYPAVLRAATRHPDWEPYLVSSPQHLHGWAALPARRGQSGPVLIEQYLRGETYTVTMDSTGGDHPLLGIAEHQLSLPPLFVSMGHLHPAVIPAERADAIAASARHALAACGHTDGRVTVFVVWTPAGPEIVRIRRADAPEDVFTQLAGLATDGRVAARSYFWLPCGVVDSVAGLAEIRALPYVHEARFAFHAGDRIPETLDARTRHGHVVLTGDTAVQVRDQIDAVRRMLRVRLRARSALVAIPRPRRGQS